MGSGGSRADVRSHDVDVDVDGDADVDGDDDVNLDAPR